MSQSQDVLSEEIIRKSKGVCIGSGIVLLVIAFFCVFKIPFLSLLAFLVSIVLFANYKYNYMVMRDRDILIKTGFLGMNIKSIPYSKINNVNCNRLTSNIIIYTGNDVTGIKFDGLPNPEIIQQKILSRINMMH